MRSGFHNKGKFFALNSRLDGSSKGGLRVNMNIIKQKHLMRMALAVLLLFAASQATAIDIRFTTGQSSLRCSGGIISVGDLDRAVRDRCGPPLAVTKRDADSYNIWVYQPGLSKFMYYLGFLHGKLQRIVSAPCSTDDSKCYDLM